MRKSLVLMAVAAAWLFSSVPLAAHAEDALSLTKQAVDMLTDAPALGGRTTVDLNKRWGSDAGVTKNAANVLHSALDSARSGGASRSAVHQLEMATAYAHAGLHKEARLSAQGALYYLCAGGGGEGCDKAPKFGSYVAP